MSLGNLLGFSKSSSVPNGITSGVGMKKNFSSNDRIKIRQSTHFTPGGKYYRGLRERVEKIGTINAIVKGPNGKEVHEKIKGKVLFDQIKRAVKSGTYNTEWRKNILKDKSFTTIDAHGNTKTYTISASEIDKRKALAKVLMPDGPSREEVAAELKKQERFRRLNVLSINRDREKEDFASQLRDKRAGGMKKSIDIRNIDNTKINATNIGAAVIHSSVSALGGKANMGVKAPVQPGFASVVANQEKEKMPDNVVSLDAHREAKSISSEPVFRTGTDG